MEPTNLILHFDGGCTHNPGGVMTWGWHVDTDMGDRIADGSGAVPGYPPEQRSSNTAEFSGILSGMRWVSHVRWLQVGTLVIRGDSQLVVNIVNGDWTARKEHLAALNRECQIELAKLRQMCDRVVVEWIPREENAEADALAGEPLEKLRHAGKHPHSRK